ncbi:MAG TPA: S46 family peptidase [Holophaga sp.]|nr:S46 family peptidase [Holophaga sp.]
MRRFTLPFLALLLSAGALRAEEGMWTFDNVPRKLLKERYGFEPTQAWLDHLRLSSLHWGGASGSFVSPDGLVLTNHHVARGSIGRISTKERDLVKTGYVARTRDEELKIPGLTVRTLVEMVNVTAQVNEAVKPGMKEARALEARRKVHEALKDETAKRTGLQCDMVSFYEGGESWIYAYKVHTDVRLVAAPELQIGLFGGDPDNFTYPRHDLDFTLFRIYEDGKPYKPQHWLTWSKEGAKHGELTFVSGHPGRTSRAWTYGRMTHEKLFAAPLSLRLLEKNRAALEGFAARSPEHRRQVTTRILGVENSLKASRGYFNGLNDVEGMKSVKAKEDALKSQVMGDLRLKALAGGAWTRIEQALQAREAWYKEPALVGALNSQFLGSALGLVRLAEAKAQPASQREAGFDTDAKLEAAAKRLTAEGPAPNLELEEHLFRSTLEVAQAELGAQHRFLQIVLKGRTPAEVAKAAVSGTRIHQTAFRKELLEGGAKALEASTDPMVVLARAIAPLAADVRRKQEAFDTVLAENSRRIAQARFELEGRNAYPDANSTLRLGFGRIETYPASGTLVQPFTTFGGLYDRHDGWGGNALAAHNGAWVLPERWLEARGKLNLSTPLNFVHSVDTIGGNSGSPIVNAKGDVVGLLFDGNYEGLPSRYFYDSRVNRSVSVDVRAIVEALDKVYDAKHLVKEVLGQ